MPNLERGDGDYDISYPVTGPDGTRADGGSHVVVSDTRTAPNSGRPAALFLISFTSTQ